MAVGAGESLLATGGADATLALWHDYTAEDQATAAAQDDAIVLRQQDLANALHVLAPPPLPGSCPLHFAASVRAVLRMRGCAAARCGAASV